MRGISPGRLEWLSKPTRPSDWYALGDKIQETSASVRDYALRPGLEEMDKTAVEKIQLELNALAERTSAIGMRIQRREKRSYG